MVQPLEGSRAKGWESKDIKLTAQTPMANGRQIRKGKGETICTEVQRVRSSSNSSKKGGQQINAERTPLVIPTIDTSTSTIFPLHIHPYRFAFDIHLLSRRSSFLFPTRTIPGRHRVRTASQIALTYIFTMAQYFFDLLYNFTDCMCCFPSSPQLKINNRSFKLLRLLGEVRIPTVSWPEA
jgi:hypothetical protein